ncbi:isoamyl acetate-hydrolyzing esterase 1 homolog isoform X1 [Thunnus albacares]|uniref:isoamyl acetate-hydrolyzing esterase 1 homolog isoform X1 n=1 Tax=Thunnus maccoyii TaxID=8240 RepID=UPI001C4AF894|nr:isoamyl acetate-hydrolyzing esterase 1 homolog isoform X1 [Thunnus maccoyii]XP_044230045.1 isoamyl acetate-hydrolyzing esterase 1 homolog isoform X1 [Thunnus albacares]
MSKYKTVIWPKVILFGDSITQFSFQANGWGSEIANRLARKCDVVNRGLSGYNSRWAKIVLPRLINSQSSADNNIAAVTVFFGANDCALEDKNPQQHISLQEYSENLKEISKLLASAGVSADKVIFITPPPIHEPAWEKECILKGNTLSFLYRRIELFFTIRACKDHEYLFICLPGGTLNRLNSVAGQYAQACVQAAGQCGTDVLDLWTLMQRDGQDYTLYLSDGLHLSEKGNQFVTEHLWALLERRVVDLPLILPYWGDVDRKSPESSLLCDQ